MKINILIITITLSCNLLVAQTNEEKFFTGNLKTDFKNVSVTNLSNSNLVLNESKEKSPILAGLMSAVIPGSGEIYAERYLKGGIFLLLEAAAWYIDILYNKKGDDQTIFFQNYADENWSVVRYAEWINQYGPNLEHNPNYAFKPITIKPDPTGTLKPWERVNWDELNYAERSISRFSHTLHPYGDQQYYELIGKYHQYSSGWKEYNGGVDYYNQIPQQMYYYADEHIKADHFYNVASKAIIFVIVNHIISFVDAIWSTNNYNTDLKASFSYQRFHYGNFTEYIPQLNIRFSF